MAQPLESVVQDANGDYESLAKLFNEEVVDWEGYRIVTGGDAHASTKNAGKLDFNPSIRTSESFMRQAHGLQRATGSITMDARRLVVAAMQDHQREQALKRLQEACTQQTSDLSSLGPKFKTAALVRRWDSTTQYLKMTASQAEKRFQWVAAELELSKCLEDSDRLVLSEMLRRSRAGFLHVNTQRGRLRWGCEPQQSERLILKSNAIQRNDAYCMGTSLGQSDSHLGLISLITILAPQVDWLTVVLGGDRYSGNERLVGELAKELRGLANVGLVVGWCGAHDGAHICQDILEGHRIFGKVLAFNRILRHSEYCEKWIIGWGKAISRARLELPMGQEAIENARRSSLPYIKRVSRLSLRRAAQIKAAAHPSGPCPKPTWNR